MLSSVGPANWELGSQEFQEGGRQSLEARRSRDCTSARKGPWDGDVVARPVSGCSDVAWGAS